MIHLPRRSLILPRGLSPECREVEADKQRLLSRWPGSRFMPHPNCYCPACLNGKPDQLVVTFGNIPSSPSPPDPSGSLCQAIGLQDDWLIVSGACCGRETVWYDGYYEQPWTLLGDDIVWLQIYIVISWNAKHSFSVSGSPPCTKTVTVTSESGTRAISVVACCRASPGTHYNLTFKLEETGQTEPFDCENFADLDIPWVDTGEPLNIGCLNREFDGDPTCTLNSA